jgi:hypothetical protein
LDYGVRLETGHLEVLHFLCIICSFMIFSVGILISLQFSGLVFGFQTLLHLTLDILNLQIQILQISELKLLYYLRVRNIKLFMYLIHLSSHKSH